MFLGVLGGALGVLMGFAFAQVVSVNVFGSSITFQPLLLPITILVSMAVAGVSCLRRSSARWRSTPRWCSRASKPTRNLR